MSARQARLRPEYASDYPGIPAGTWLAAADMGLALLRAHLVSPTPPELGSRLMDESKFEFQGGRARDGDTSAQTRHGEPGAA